MLGLPVAVAFIAGLALGFPLGVLSYLATYALFQKLFEDRARQRIAKAKHAASVQAQKLQAIREKFRSTYGSEAPEEISEEVEQVLSGGPR